MPLLRSPKKEMRKSRANKARNASIKANLKGLIKQVRALAAEAKTKEAGEAFRKAVSALDKAAKVNIINTNKARRTKSRLSKTIKAADKK